MKIRIMLLPKIKSSRLFVAFLCLVIVPSCNRQQEKTIAFFDKKLILGQTLSSLKNNNRLEREDNGGMKDYEFYTQDEQLSNKMVRCRFFYGFFENKLVFVQVDADSVENHLMPFSIREQGFQIFNTTSSSKTYKRSTTTNYCILQIDTKNKFFYKLHFIAAETNHLGKFKIDSTSLVSF